MKPGANPKVGSRYDGEAERVGVDKDTRSLIIELEKRLATAERRWAWWSVAQSGSKSWVVRPPYGCLLKIFFFLKDVH